MHDSIMYDEADEANVYHDVDEDLQITVETEFLIDEKNATIE